MYVFSEPLCLSLLKVLFSEFSKELESDLQVGLISAFEFSHQKHGLLYNIPFAWHN